MIVLQIIWEMSCRENQIKEAVVRFGENIFAYVQVSM